MAHHRNEEWVDYLNGLTEPARRGAMAAHLDDGCRRCRRVVATLERVRAAARRDRRLEVPAAAVRTVRALFALQRPAAAGWRRLRLELLADSALEPAAAGLRSGESGPRRLRWAGPELELEVELGGSASGISLTGELRAEPAAEVPAFLVGGGRILACAATDELGGFALDAAEPAEDLRLCLALPEDRLIEVELAAPALA